MDIFSFLVFILRKRTARSLGNKFTQGLRHSVFPPAVQEGSPFSTPSPTLVLDLFSVSHPPVRKMGTHPGVDLYTLRANDGE